MTILVEAHAGYRLITLNRPERLNALTIEIADALMGALDQAEVDEGCRAVLLTGAGRAFCAGQDLTQIVGAGPDEISDLLDRYNPLIRKIRTLPKPVVAAVNGVAAGAGANLALACDIVLAAKSASFLQAFAKIGLIPDCGGTWFLPRLVGPARARGLAMLAEALPAETAAAWGMIWQAIDDERLMNEAHAMAARLAKGPTIALGLVKEAIEAAASNSLDEQLDFERDLQADAADTPDHPEGVRAFLAKEAPAFIGRRS